MTGDQREAAALAIVTAWLALPVSERIQRKERYRQTLERCATCDARLTYSRRPTPHDIQQMKVA